MGGAGIKEWVWVPCPPPTSSLRPGPQAPGIPGAGVQAPRTLPAGTRPRRSPVLLNCRVHMHLPSLVHCSQSAAPHTASEQFPAQKTSRWLMRQSFSEVQDPLRPMQAPSGQLVHHLQRGAEAWGGGTGSEGLSGPPAPPQSQFLPPDPRWRAPWCLKRFPPSPITHLSISRLQGPGVAGQALATGSQTPTFLGGVGHRGAGGAATAQPGEVGGLAHHAQPGSILPAPGAPPWCLLDTGLKAPQVHSNWSQHRPPRLAPPELTW